jgi:ABC-type polysaccharide/polyol phosphate export permease
MLSRLILAVVIAVIVTLACTLVGAILISLGVAIATTIGDFLRSYSAALGVLSGLWYYFSGATWWPRKQV